VEESRFVGSSGSIARWLISAMKKDGCPIRRYRRPPQRCRAQPCSLSRPSAIGVVRRASPSYVATGRSRLPGQRAHGLWRKICPRGCVFHPRRSDNTSHQSAASTIAVRSSSDYGAVSRDNARNERAERGPSMSGPMNSYIPGNPGHACRRRRVSFHHVQEYENGTNRSSA
jgi:hypothetical protein